MLTHIRLTNYRAHQSTELLLGKHMTLLLGGNQSGKTSVRLALEAAMSARNEMTNERGTGLRQQIRSGALEARVEVDSTQGRHVLELPQGKLSGPVYPERIVRACLRRGWLLGLPAKEQRAFLQSDLRLAPEMGEDEWRVALNGWTPAFPDLGDWWLERCGPIDDLSREAIYKSAYQLRADQKATVALLEQSAAVPPRPEGLTADEAELRRIRDTQQQQLATLRAERATRDQTHAAEMSAWQAEERRHEDADRRVADAQRRVETIAQAAIEANQRRGKGSKSITSLRKKLREAEQARDVATQERSLKEVELQALAGAEGVCPTGRCARLEMQTLTAALKEATGAIAEAQRQVDATISAIAECEKRDREADVLSQQSAEAERAVQEAIAAKAALDPLPAPPSRMADEGYATMLADAEDRLRQTDATLARFEAARDELAVWQAAVKAHEAAAKHLEIARDELARANALVDAKTGALTEAGVIERMWRSTLQGFLGEVNMELVGLLGTGKSALRVVIDDPWQIVLDSGDVRIPIEQASQAEQTWVSAAFQVVIARRASFPIIALDELGTLDGNSRRVFYGWALGLDRQVLLCAAAQDVQRNQLVRPPYIEVDGLEVYWLEGGRAHAIGGEEAAA